MSAEASSNPGNVSNASHKASASAKDEYYRYMLLKEKAQAAAGTPAEGEIKAILNARSEQDDVEMKILNKIVHVRESTPEWNQLVDLTGSRNRFEQARILAEITYEKAKAEKVLGFYTPDASVLKSDVFDKTNQAALRVRAGVDQTGLSGLDTKGAATKLAAVFGLAAP